MERKEAIKKVRSWNLPKETREILEALAPELKESEDERIRKWLIKLVNDGLTCFPDSLMRSDVLAYLEKQKESTWTEEDESFRKHILPRILDPKGWTLEQVEADKGLLKEFVERQKNKWVEKQKESLHITETCKEKADSFTDEDEEIRKKLVEIIGYFRSRGINQQLCEEFLDYLGKQKEHQFCSDAPKEKSVGGDFYSSHKDKNLDEIAQDYVNGVKEYNPEPTWDLMQTAVCYGYHLAEQKPTEWSKEEEDMMKDTIRAFQLAYPFALEYENPRRKNIDWLKSLPERFNLQPKQEWSEEDEKLFWGLTAYVPEEELKRLGVTRDDILKKLKSIRPQPIQLKEAYKDGFQTARHAAALAFMNYLDENRPDGKMSLSNGECEDIDKAFKEGDWAKIMRYYEKYSPSWKPSEQEKGALRTAIHILTDERSFPKAAAHLQNILDAFEGKESRKDWKPSEDEESKK